MSYTLTINTFNDLLPSTFPVDKIHDPSKTKSCIRHLLLFNSKSVLSYM